MARKAFFSFHYKPDNWRAAQVRAMGIIEGNAPVSDNDWETIAGGGDTKIEKWINDQMYGKSCVIVLIGSETAGRRWINYEIEKAWYEKKGVVGIYIHNLKDSFGKQTFKGRNPFEDVTIHGLFKLSRIVKAYDLGSWKSQEVYNDIKDNMEDWVEEAISIRNQWPNGVVP